MKITSREVDCDKRKAPVVKIWCECHTLEDVDEVIAWLHLAQKLMRDTMNLDNEGLSTTTEAE